MLYELFRYLHFFAIFGLAATLVIENMAIKPLINSEDARNLARVDSYYGMSAGLVFLFGLTLWLWVGKPAEFYSSNPLFHAKLGLFLVVALLSIYPTVFFIRNRNNASDSISVPGAVRVIMRLELALLLVMPVLGTLIARGIGIPAG